MHELGIVFHVIKHVEQVGQAHGLSAVRRVTLELGEVSGVVGEYLADCWKWAAAKSPLLQDAALEIETIPAVTFCQGCNQTYETVQYGRICPYCASEDTYLLVGNEVNIKEIEAC